MAEERLAPTPPPVDEAKVASGDSGRSFIEIDGVGVTYIGADGRPVTALDGIDLTIRDKEFVSLIGPSGCGKTTLLNILADLVAPSKGTVRIDGRSPRAMREARMLGCMFQESLLLPWRNVEQNMRLLSDIAGKKLAEGRIAELARTLEIEDFLHNFPHELSGGMQQRVAIGRTLALDPVLLLMDEPFGALDEITRGKMNFELLRVWSEHRKTVVFVTHSITEAAFLSDRVVVLTNRPGRVVADIKIELPRPRTKDMMYSAEMNNYVGRLHEYLEESPDRT